MNCLVSTYLTTKKDPQRNTNWDSNDFGIIENYYNSVVSHGLTSFILADNISEEFIDTYENENVKFIHCPPPNANTIDDRWFLYYDFLVILLYLY